MALILAMGCWLYLCESSAPTPPKLKNLHCCSDHDCLQLSYLYHHTGVVPIKEFQANDYEFFCHHYLDSAIASRLDYDKIYRFASNLNGYQLHRTCLELNQDTDLTTGKFIEYLKSQQLSSNVDLGEVQAVDLSSLKGIDDVLQSLEANLIIPLEQDDLANRTSGTPDPQQNPQT